MAVWRDQVWGLSPRLRGNVVPRNLSCQAMRSIPALAGERKTDTKPEHEVGVYPRACGGTIKSMAQCCHNIGLSPRLRGNGDPETKACAISGSIPALAGERRTVCGMTNGFWVYPRACGGTAAIVASRPLQAGLSPRLRGNAWPSEKLRRLPGSIPALAGERGDRL